MSNTRISALTAVTTPALTDTYPVVQSGTTKQITATQMRTLMPGAEIDYVSITSSANPTATTEGTANTVITGTSFTADGTTLMVEFYSPQLRPPTTNASLLNIVLFEASTVIGQIAEIKNATGANTNGSPGTFRVRHTPSAGTRQYIVKAYVNTGTGIIGAGAGGTGNLVAAYLRITKV